jgi:rhodanese-related sulfurtransferase
MQNNLYKSSLVLCTVALMFFVAFGSAVDVGVNKQLTEAYNEVGYTSYTDITNITVWDVWNMTNDHSSIQLLVDVRTNEEWNSSWLDTPYPESPIHYELALLQVNETLQEFINLYNNSEIIFQCKSGGRSWQAAKILAGDSNFTGTIYNMMGGITAWIAAGLPVRTNANPDVPIIDGLTRVKVNKLYDFTFNATDPNNDGVKYFIDWGDNFSQWTDYDYSSKEITVSHSWSKPGTAYITAKAIDFYGNESDLATLEITVPRTTFSVKILFLEFLEKLMDRFPLLERVLNI